MSCVLRIAGKDLNVEKIVNTLTIKPYRISKKGDPVFKTKPGGKKITLSGISFLVSKADFTDLKKQIKDAIKFLEKNKADLKKITLNKSVEFAVLDFGITLRIGYNNVALQSDYFPFELLKLAGDLRIGIEASLYPPPLKEV